LQVHTAKSAIEAALALDAGGPVCINETGDNTGCGAPGDSTHLLRALLDARLDAGVACFGWMYDPDVLKQCFEAGVGAKIDVVLVCTSHTTCLGVLVCRCAGWPHFVVLLQGGKLEEGHGLAVADGSAIAGGPIVAQAHIRVLNDGVFPARIGSVGSGSMRHLGKMARVTIGNVDVLINGSRQQSFDEVAFTFAGIDIARYKICAIKSSTHFRAGWAPVSSTILTVDEPGWSSNNLDVFEPMRITKVSRWPTTPDAKYPARL
jgi:microcystin degradation protein MlrC